MKLFGQFLIDEKLITKEDFVSAMIIQAESLPSLPLAVRELKLFDLDTQVAIFAYQANHFKEYRAACLEMGIWDESSIEHPLGRYFLSRLKPLGEILVEQGLLTLKQLAVQLERYVALGDQTYTPMPAKSVPHIALVQDTAKSFADVNVSRHPVRDLDDSEKRLYRLFCDSLNEEFMQRMRSFFSSPDAATRQQLTRELKSYAHAAKFINAFKSRDLLSKLVLVTESSHIYNPSEQALIEQGLKLVWTLREGLCQGMTEFTTLGSNALDSRVDEISFILGKIGATA